MQPNVLFIMADQFRADALGVVGGYARTPHLDGLAVKGTRFDRVYANSAECVPSRFSLATGLYPHQIGIDHNRRATLDPARPNWMQHLASAGYETSLFGKTHLHPHEGDIRDRVGLMHAYGLQIVEETTGPRAAVFTASNMTDTWKDAGFFDAYTADFADRFATKAFVARPSPLPVELYYDAYVGRTARTYLGQAPTEKPWFCWVSFGGPHEPWDAPEPYASMYQPSDMPPPIPPAPEHWKGLVGQRRKSSNYSPDMLPSDILALRANYAANVTLIDDEIGKILSVIESTGQLANTIVVFTSDHGEMNGDHGLIYKANFLDQVINVPLIIADFRIGREQAIVDRGLAELVDVGPTICDMAIGSRPEGSQGLSLAGRVGARFEGGRDFAVCEFAGHACVITPELKVEFDVERRAVLAFDRIADPSETTDVSESLQFADALASSAALFDDLIRKTPSTPCLLPE